MAYDMIVGQAGAPIYVTMAGVDLGTGATAVIQYRKPRSGARGSWTATVDSGNSRVSYTPTATTELDEAGTWILSAVATKGGVVTPTMPVAFRVGPSASTLAQ